MADETKDPLREDWLREKIERLADVYDQRATEFDSIGEPELARPVTYNEAVAKILRAALSAVSAPAPAPLRAEVERIASEIEEALRGPKGLERGALSAAGVALRTALSAPESPGAALAVVREQAWDAGLWCVAEHIMEDYLQRALRRLHAAVEADASVVVRLRSAPPPDGADVSPGGLRALRASIQGGGK